MTVITFENRAPIRIADVDRIETVWDAGRDFGHERLRRYTTLRGKHLYWITSNSGEFYGNHSSPTRRTYLRNVDEIEEYFIRRMSPEVFHAEIQELVDPGSVLDVDALP